MARRSVVNIGMLLSVVLAASQCWGSGYEFEGIGAREVSRGGAAIADSADWTAIYWNPANITRAVDEKKADVGLELFGGQAHAKDSNSLSSLVGPVFSKDKLDSNFILGALGGVMKLTDRVGIGAGFYTPLLQGVDFSDDSAFGNHLHYKGSAGILTWALEAAMKVTDKLSAGAGVDVLYGKLTSDSTLSNFPIAGSTAHSRQSGDGAAVEGIFGLRYQPNPQWAIGGVYRTGADVGIKGDARFDSTSPFIPSEATKFRYELRHPPTTGLGVSYKPDDKWSFDTDFTQTYWHRFSNAFTYQNQGAIFSNTANTFHWRDSWKLRFGMGVWATEKTELLAGYSYDKQALDPGSVDFATTVDVPMNRVYAGASHRWSEKWETTLGGVYGAGKRSEATATFHLSGWQVMLESRLRV